MIIRLLTSQQKQWKPQAVMYNAESEKDAKIKFYSVQIPLKNKGGNVLFYQNLPHSLPTDMHCKKERTFSTLRDMLSCLSTDSEEVKSRECRKNEIIKIEA